MARQYLLGNEALAHAALEGGAGFVAGYPGTPSSEVIDLLRAERPEGVHVEWSTNEKVAFENALAAAWCGVRSLFTTKHVGLNVAADPLMTSAYTGVTGGLVSSRPTTRSPTRPRTSRTAGSTPRWRVCPASTRLRSRRRMPCSAAPSPSPRSSACP